MTALSHWTVFLHDSYDDQAESDKASQVDEWLRVLRDAPEAEDDSGHGIQAEREREQEEKAVGRLSPVAQEEEHGHERRHSHGAHEQ